MPRSANTNKIFDDFELASTQEFEEAAGYIAAPSQMSRRELAEAIAPLLLGLEAKCRAGGLTKIAQPLGEAVDALEDILVPRA